MVRDLGLEIESNEAMRRAIIERVDIDANNAGPASLFLPRGSKTAKSRLQDPADQVRRALGRGVALALTTEDRSRFAPEAPVIQVANLIETARRLAEIGRSRFGGTLLGITGSVGKTTTKDMMNHAFSFFGPTYATRGNYNEIDGVLMTLAALPPEARYALIEVCSTKPDSVPAKARFVQPHIGMVTVIGHSHGANYPSRYDILRDKLAMLDDLTGPRIAVLGRSVVEYDAAEENLLAGKSVDHLITVGQEKGDTVRLRDAELTGQETRVSVELDGRDYRIVVPFAGRQYVDAALFTMAGAYAMDIDLKQVAEVISATETGHRRGERIRVAVKDREDVVEVIDDAQNAAPESVRALLELVSLRDPGRRVLVFGDMLELGDEAEAMHDSLAEDIRAAGINVLVTVGPLAGRVAAPLKGGMEVHQFDTTDAALKKIRQIIRHGDLVALKGSGGLQLERILPVLAPQGRRNRAKAGWSVEQESGERPLPERSLSLVAPDVSAAAPAVSAPAASSGRIADFGAFLFRIGLKKGFKTSRFTTKVAANYLLAMRIGNRVSVGEASPRSIALTGDDRKLAGPFFKAARQLLVGREISAASPAAALADVRRLMARLEALAEQMAGEANREKPYRACLAGLDIMLLNGAAELHGMTLADFLGRQRPDVGVSATTLSVSDAVGKQLVESVRRHLQRYPACRAKGMSDTDRNIEILQAVRTVSREMGQDKIAWVDMNEAYTPDTAPALIARIAEEARAGTVGGTVILEQPVPKRYYKEMCELQAFATETTKGLDLDLLLLADESLWDLSDLKRLQAAGGCLAINIKVQKCGGLLKALEVAEMAVRFDPKTRIYIGGMIGTSDLTSRALLNLAAALQRFDFITSGPRANIKSHIVTEPLKWTNKTNRLPAQTGPGLGLEVDWTVVLEHVDEADKPQLHSFLASADIPAPVES
ncbi:enolase C-terminal domain-like protein [Limimaricola cinnabarinus]|uniref:enolase C-terminal domain-like protein n=1 Tax=Limimaricola cinnabarinus TaxID=1125964 RepID=UPI002491FF95|nr:enolase C-terminal domain-like protein [Limimaricola cinnabarinus]